MNSVKSFWLFISLFFFIALPAKSSVDQQIKLRWLVQHAPNDYFVKMANHFKKNIEKRTNGRVSIEVVDETGCFKEFQKGSKRFSNALTNDDYRKILLQEGIAGIDSKYLNNLINNQKFSGSPIELRRAAGFKALVENQVDIAQTYSHFLADTVSPNMHVLELPFLFSNYEDVEKLIDSKLGDQLMTSFDKMGIQGLAYTYSGGLLLTIARSNYELNKIENWNGLRFRAESSQVRNQYLESLGMKSLENILINEKVRPQISYRVTYLINKNYIDAEEINLPDFENWFQESSADRSKKLKKFKVYETQHTLLSTILLVNNKALAKLTPEDQKIFKEVAKESGKFERDLTISRYLKAKIRAEKSGFQVVKISTPTKAELKKRANAVYEWLFAKYPETKNVVEQYYQLVKSHQKDSIALQ